MNYSFDSLSLLFEFNTNKIRPLTETYPELTGNVKIRYSKVDDKVTLTSIPIHPDLNTSVLNKFDINSEFGYSMDVSRYYKNFRAKGNKFFLRGDSQFSSLYKKGYFPLVSELYDETSGFFAPLFVGDDVENIPEYFDIRAIKKEKYNELKTPDEYKDALLYDSVPVTTFDLTKKTAIGKYIRQHAQFIRENNFWDVESQSYKTATIRPVSGSQIYETSIHNQYEFSLENYEIFGIPLKMGIHGSFINLFNRNIAFKESGLTQQQLKDIFKNFVLDSFSKNQFVFPRILNLDFVYDIPANIDITEYVICGYYGTSTTTLQDYNFKNTFVFNTNYGGILDIDSMNQYLNNPIQTKIFYNLPSGEFYSTSEDKHFTISPAVLDTNKFIDSFITTTINDIQYFKSNVDTTVKIIIDDTTHLRYDTELSKVFYEDIILNENDVFLKISETHPELNGFYTFDDYFIMSLKKIEKFLYFGNSVVLCLSGKYAGKIYELKNDNFAIQIDTNTPLFVEKDKKSINGFYGFLNRFNNIDIIKSCQYLKNQKLLNVSVSGYEKYPAENVLGTSNNTIFDSFYAQYNTTQWRESIKIQFPIFREGDSIVIENKSLNHSGHFRWRAIFTDNESYSLYSEEHYTPTDYILKTYNFIKKLGVENVPLLEFIIPGLKLKDLMPGEECYIQFYSIDNTIKTQDTFLIESLFYDETKDVTVFNCIDLYGSMTRYDISKCSYIVFTSKNKQEKRIYFNLRDSEDLGLNVVRAFNTFTNRTFEIERLSPDTVFVYSKNTSNQKHTVDFNFTKSLNDIQKIKFNDISAAGKYRINIQDIKNYSSLLQTQQIFLYPRTYKDSLSKLNLFRQKDDYDMPLAVSGFKAGWDIKLCRISDVSNNVVGIFYKNDFEWVTDFPSKIRISNVPEEILNKLELSVQYKIEIEPLNKYNTIIDSVYTYVEKLKDNSVLFSDKKQISEPNGKEYIVAKEGLSDLQFFDVQGTKVFYIPGLEFDNAGNLIKNSVLNKYTIFLNNHTYNALLDYDNYISARYPFSADLMKFMVYPDYTTWLSY